METTFLLQMLLNGLQLASIYILIALGFTLIFGILHIVNIAHGSLYMLGAYTTWILISFLGVGFILSLIVSMVTVGIIGVGFEKLIFRRLHGMVMPTIIASMGLTEIINQSVLLGFGTKEKVVSNPFPGVVEIFGTVFPIQRIVVMIIATTLMILLVWWVQKSKAGLALRALALDKDTASLYGISFNRYGSLAFAIGCALAGAAGSLMGTLFYIEPHMGETPLMKIFVIIVVGGLGSVPGAIIAGLLLGFIDSFIATLFDSVIASIVGFAMIIVVLIFRPTGFFGHE
jgi:branched-chain amino acid transport system permease protein